MSCQFCKTILLCNSDVSLVVEVAEQDSWSQNLEICLMAVGLTSVGFAFAFWV